MQCESWFTFTCRQRSESQSVLHTLLNQLQLPIQPAYLAFGDPVTYFLLLLLLICIVGYQVELGYVGNLDELQGFGVETQTS